MEIKRTDEKRSFPAEWAPQWGVLMTWPHADSDWAPTLPAVKRCYRHIIDTITAGGERVLLIVPPHGNDDYPTGNLITTAAVTTNDTWTRDYGPISIIANREPWLLDFTFNAWGMKFAANHDNLVSAELAKRSLLPHPLQSARDIVLEGGSIESDGHYTVMTTSRCLLSSNRNDTLSLHDIEQMLRERLGARQVLWLDHGAIDGDDTDSHIDTLARFAPADTILYSPGSSPEETALMRQQLATFRNIDGKPYRLIELPLPDKLFDDEGSPMPATYANFLVANTRVLVPTYGQPTNDSRALRLIADAFPGRETIGIDCRPLIVQHGSLHCATMQIVSSKQ